MQFSNYEKIVPSIHWDCIFFLLVLYFTKLWNTIMYLHWPALYTFNYMRFNYVVIVHLFSVLNGMLLMASFLCSQSFLSECFQLLQLLGIANNPVTHFSWGIFSWINSLMILIGLLISTSPFLIKEIQKLSSKIYESHICWYCLVQRHKQIQPLKKSKYVSIYWNFLGKFHVKKCTKDLKIMVIVYFKFSKFNNLLEF